MSERTIWEEGRESGRHVVALGSAISLTVTFVDLLIDEQVGLLFDLTFVAIAVTLALIVRPSDFFVVGVLPPLIMLGIFILLATTQPGSIADRDDSAVQAVISGLGHHSISLFIGYAACLGCLVMRRRVLRQRSEEVDEDERERAMAS
ncbi:hypothetical protein FB381_3723 [Nocardioides albertanoniae]|uniref:DUF6542 domain-containing protein n=1 Tax=Nocardioides albertanoniae TaxID=1175486 RepID=A0A543AB88_9ACTN|nr:DUF6542 domain-containing protein [Nocardioides albertanoniae]TQL69807.1 hypothetical protein FB381_3723 [Nocardioides albertanoniae]